MPLVGGNCNNGLNCGAYVNLNNTAGNANWNIAPGHSYQTMEDQPKAREIPTPLAVEIPLKVKILPR